MEGGCVRGEHDLEIRIGNTHDTPMQLEPRIKTRLSHQLRHEGNLGKTLYLKAYAK